MIKWEFLDATRWGFCFFRQRLVIALTVPLRNHTVRHTVENRHTQDSPVCKDWDNVSN
ncbi:MAG: hypothetical protein ACLTNW_17520 [Mediterraneibacter gnavus]